MRTFNFHLEYRERPYLFWAIFSLLILLTGAYLYFVNSLIFGAAEHQKRLNVLRQAETEVAMLEAAYLKITSRITLDLAHQLGYRDAADRTVFIQTP